MKRKSVSLCKLLRLKQQFERETINSCDLPQFVTIFRVAKNIWELLRFSSLQRVCVWCECEATYYTRLTDKTKGISFSHVTVIIPK